MAISALLLQFQPHFRAYCYCATIFVLFFQEKLSGPLLWLKEWKPQIGFSVSLVTDTLPSFGFGGCYIYVRE